MENKNGIMSIVKNFKIMLLYILNFIENEKM